MKNAILYTFFSVLLGVAIYIGCSSNDFIPAGGGFGGNGTFATGILTDQFGTPISGATLYLPAQAVVRESSDANQMQKIEDDAGVLFLVDFDGESCVDPTETYVRAECTGTDGSFTFSTDGLDCGSDNEITLTVIAPDGDELGTITINCGQDNGDQSVTDPDAVPTPTPDSTPT
jgi:hypothetical protein